jgi:hypothetical protein
MRAEFSMTAETYSVLVRKAVQDLESLSTKQMATVSVGGAQRQNVVDGGNLHD